VSHNSNIEWTGSTWNPITGCTKISPGCKYCYAERLAKRLQAMGSPNYKNGFRITLQPHVVELPLSWHKPKMIFVNSMSDLFHEKVPSQYIQKVFNIMQQAAHHHFQILTKRAERLEEFQRLLPWPDNVWMGVTVENKDYIYRIDHLRKTGAKIKFISFEPLLGPINSFNLEGIDWVIAGGESGPRARPMRAEWVTQIRDHCLTQKVPFFFKQWGGINKKKTGRLLEGRTLNEMPIDLLVLTS